jgi:opacity protein-like surface antigen
MKNLTRTFALLCFLALAAGSAQAQAQVSLGVQGGYNLDAFTDQGAEEGTYHLGAQVRFGLAQTRLVLNPSVDYFFNHIEDANTFQVNGDVIAPLGINNTVFTPYVGLGLAVTRVSFNSDAPIVGDLLESDETDLGLNVLGGATFGTGPVQPFAQARITFGNHLAFVNDDGQAGPGYALMGGVLFRLR